MVNEHSFDYFPSPSGFNLKDISSHIFMPPFYLSSEVLLNFL